MSIPLKDFRPINVIQPLDSKVQNNYTRIYSTEEQQMIKNFISFGFVGRNPIPLFGARVFIDAKK